jgi:hypothetical protein
MPDPDRAELTPEELYDRAFLHDCGMLPDEFYPHEHTLSHGSARRGLLCILCGFLIGAAAYALAYWLWRALERWAR